MSIPDVHYAHSGPVAIAYQVVGEGPDLVYVPHLTNLYSLWTGSRTEPFLRRLAAETRLSVFNPRGTGLSDRPRAVTLESRMDDILAVLEAIGCAKAAILGVGESANVCALFAATYPERCDRVVLFGPYARSVRSDSYPYGATEAEWHEWISEMRARFGERDFLTEFARMIDPSLADDEATLDWFVWMHRLSASPGAAAEFAKMQMETDLTDVLPSIRRPTLVAYRAGDRETAAFVADLVPGASRIELPDQGSGPYTDGAVDAVLAFVRGEAEAAVPESVLATLLFTDLVGSTERAAELGDRRWRDLLSEHHRQVRRQLVRHRGTEVDSAGDGFFCRFDGPARAIACARAIVEDALSLEPLRACRCAHRGVRARGREDRGDRRARGRAARLGGRSGRGPRLGHRDGPRCGVGLLLRGSGRARVEGHPGLVARLCGGTVSAVTDAFLVDAVRSPIGRRNGSLAGLRADDLAAQVLDGLTSRLDVDPA